MNPLLQISKLIFLLVLLAASTSSAFYDPTLGRWLNRDPLQEESFNDVHPLPSLALGPLSKRVEVRLGPNLYAFVGNDSIMRIDPYGTDPMGDYLKCLNKKVACICKASNTFRRCNRDALLGMPITPFAGVRCIFRYNDDVNACEDEFDSCTDLIPNNNR
jgi:hypothetical protein